VLRSSSLSERSFDAIVVGGGVIGCASAHALARAGARVLLLERDRVAGGASGAAAGMLAPGSESESADAWFALLLHARNGYAELGAHLREETGLDVEYQPSGLLRVALDEVERDLLRRRAMWMSEAGVRAEWLEPEDALRLEPALAPGIAGALWLPDEAHVRSPRVARALARAAAQCGTVVRESVSVLGFQGEGTRILGVRTTEGVFEARSVVLAAGAWCGPLTAELPQPLPVAPVKGQIVAAAALGHGPRHIVWGLGAYLVPKVDGQLVVGATEEDAGFDTRPTLGGVAGLIKEAARLVPAVTDLPFDAAWAGLRPATPNRKPLICPVAGAEGLIAATGHFRNGVLLGPITGRVVADLVLRGEHDMAGTEAAWFRGVGALS
jgi:glycine oxidase